MLIVVLDQMAARIAFAGAFAHIVAGIENRLKGRIRRRGETPSGLIVTNISIIVFF